MTANKNITANHLPIELDAYSPVSLQNIGEAVVGRKNRNRLAIYIPHSIAELLVIDKTMKPLPLMKLNDDKTVLSTGFIGTYDGWPMVTDTFGYGFKHNFLISQLVELRDTPYDGAKPVGSCRLPAELREYNSFDQLKVLNATPNMGLAVLITRDVWYAVVDDEYFGSHFVPCPDPQKIAEGYVGSFQDFDIVVPVHDSVHLPIDLEPGMYLFKPIEWEGSLLKDSDGEEGTDGVTQAFDMNEVAKTLASAPKPDPELLAQNEAITKTLALATDYEHENVVLYSAVSKIEKSKFAEVQLIELQNVDEIAKAEAPNAVYFLSRKQHGVFMELTLNSSEFHAAVQYEDLLDGFLGTLHGRPIVTDAFVAGNADRHDLNGLYIVEVASESSPQ